VPAAWNDTAVAYPLDLCVHALVEAQAERTPEAVAVEFGAGRLTYRALNRQANRLAHYLRRLGVGPEVLVGVCMERSLEMVVALLAVLKAGGAYVPVDPAYPAERMAYMLTDAQAPVLLTQARLVSRLPEAGARLLVLDGAGQPWAGESDANPDSGVTAENLAYVIYTSGSTGKPKGVMNEHRGIGNRLFWMQERYPLTPEDVVLQKTPYSFDVSVPEFFGTLLAGARLVMAEPGGHQDPAYLARVIQERGVTQCHFVPSMLQVFLDEPGLEESCRSLRRVLASGEALSYELQERFFRRLGADLLNLYGPTEAAVEVSYWPCRRGGIRRPVPIGYPVANVQLYVLDEAMQPVPVGETGELYIGGVAVARGYWRRPELTAERFVPNPLGPGRLYRTGDRARWLPEGAIEYLGRLDHQVKLRGLRIELGEIEAVLAQHPSVREAVVLAREDQPGNQRLVAYVVPTAGAQVTVSELRQFLRTQLPEYMVPTAFVTLPAMPLTTSGKVDRKALPAPSAGRGGPFEAPLTPTEQALAEIWTGVLGLEQIGRNDNFFDLGGHSLLATQVFARVRNALGVDLAVPTLFEAPTVAALAEKVVTAMQGQGGLQAQPLERLARTGPQPLSFAQQRLWLTEQLEPGNAAYHIPALLRLSGPLDRGALERALAEIIRRHETLRTVFLTVDGEPMQEVLPEAAFALTVTDLRDVPEREARAYEMALADARRPFNLAADPMLRAALLQLDETEHLLVVTIHHIASDGWSIGIFEHELSALYQAFAAGRPAPLPDLPIRYTDFAAWQRTWLQSGVMAEQLGYWQRQLAGLPVLQLPTDRPRPVKQSYRGAIHQFTVPPALAEQLKALSRSEGATLFMTLLAAFQVLLHRYSGQADFGVGSPVANRTRTETEGLIGFFVNTWVSRADLSDRPTFREMLGRVRDGALDAYIHQDVPFDKLVEVLNPERTLGHHPLFQVMFAMQNTPGSGLDLPGLTVKALPADTGTARFDMDLSVSESEQGLAGEVTYSTDLFDRTTIERMMQNWQRLLEAAVADPDERVDRLPLLTEAERHQVLVVWNRTATGYPRDQLIPQLITEQAAQQPEALAVAMGAGPSLTYRQLNRQANQLAHFLRRQGVGTDVPVALWLERSPALVAGMLGAMKAGGAYVPIDPTYPVDRVTQILEDSGAPVLLTHARLAAELPQVGARVTAVEAVPWSCESDANPAGPIHPEDLAYIIYTSGSTGRPKGVEVSHRALLNLVWWFRRAYALTPADRVSYAAGISFDATVSELWPALSAGASLHLPDEESRVTPAKLRNWLLNERLTVAFAPTPMAEALLGLDWPAQVPLRVLYTGGDKLRLYPPPGLPFALADNYGPTECACISTYAVIPPQGQAEGAPHIGRPIDNVQTYILDGLQQPVPIGVPGELYVGGESVGRGYRNLPELTAERFLTNPFGPGMLYRTGDLARYLPDGNIECLGRMDHQVKVRGYRIELGEVESVLARHPAVREAVVAAREDRPGNRRLAAYLVLDAESAPDDAELRRFLRKQLPEYMVPAAFVTLAALPVTANGKVDRRALPAPPAVGAEGVDVPYEAPRTPTEQALAEIWAQVLRVRRVGIHDNFFALGGYSLLAAQAVTHANARLGVALTIRHLFEAPTVAALAEAVEGALLGALSDEELAAMLEELEADERG
jgi:amino acid adenylation domain-containing protein